MVTPVEQVSKNLLALGGYDLVLFAIFAALFYAALRKSKILGDSPVINGVLSLGISFLVFGFPIITGIGSLLYNMTSFFTQATVIALVFFIAFLIASFFYPDMTGILAKTFAHRTTLWTIIALVVVLFLTSGLVTVLWKKAPSSPVPPGGTAPSSGLGGINVPDNVLLFVAGIGIFMVFIIIATSMVRSE